MASTTTSTTTTTRIPPWRLIIRPPLPRRGAAAAVVPRVQSQPAAGADAEAPSNKRDPDDPDDREENEDDDVRRCLRAFPALARLAHPRLVWCLITTFVISAYYWCAVVVHSWYVGVGVTSLSTAAAASDIQALLMLGFGAVYTGENLAFYYWFGTTKYGRSEALKRMFQARLLLWGVAMFFAIALLIVRNTSPTGLHDPFSVTFFCAFMVSWVVAQAQQTYITVAVIKDADERKKRAAALVIQLAVWMIALSTGLTFTLGRDTVCQDVCAAWVEYVAGGVGLMYGTFKFLD